MRNLTIYDDVFIHPTVLASTLCRTEDPNDVDGEEPSEIDGRPSEGDPSGDTEGDDLGSHGSQLAVQRCNERIRKYLISISPDYPFCCRGDMLESPVELGGIVSPPVAYHAAV